MQDLERAKKLSFDLLMAFDLNIFTIQLNFITQSVVSKLDICIVILLLIFLCILEDLLTDNQQFFELGSLLFYSF